MNTDHILVAPTGYLIRCSCGWTLVIPRLISSARYEFIRAALAAHEQSTKAEALLPPSSASAPGSH